MAAYESGRIVDGFGNGIHGCKRHKSPSDDGSSATMTSSMCFMSEIERVCGTTTSIVGTRGQLPRTEMRPREGVYATSELFEAGARPEDQVSSPRPKAAKLAAVAVPEPLE